MPVDPLESLRDIHLPAAVSWWPPAAGWWWVTGLCLFVLVSAFLWWRKQKNSDKNSLSMPWSDIILAAEGELNDILEQRRLGGRQHAPIAIPQLSLLMKRVAMHHPEASSAVAGMTGTPWLQWLDSQWPEPPNPEQNDPEKNDSNLYFSGQLGQLLIDAPYRRSFKVKEERVSELFSLCRCWLAAQEK